jgi:hypothetical protein
LPKVDLAQQNHYLLGNIISGVNVKNIFFRKGVLWSPSLVVLTVLGTAFSAVAQTVDTPGNRPLTQAYEIEASPSYVNAKLPITLQSPGSIANQNSAPSMVLAQQFPNAETELTASRTATPVPGTVTNTSAALSERNLQATAKQTSSGESIDGVSHTKVAQADIEPGDGPRRAKSYIGIAANIGISGGDSSLSDGNFAVFSKVGLSKNLSIRPSAVLGDTSVIMVPVTYDFSFQSTSDPFSEPLPFAPYVGVGAAIKTGDSSKVGFLVSGGVDLPLNAQFTATAALNAGFFDKTDVGLLLGVGYNFGGF